MKDVMSNLQQTNSEKILLSWVRQCTRSYPEVNVLNFTTSWADGLALNGILHHFRWREYRVWRAREQEMWSWQQTLLLCLVKADKRLRSLLSCFCVSEYFAWKWTLHFPYFKTHTTDSTYLTSCVPIESECKLYWAQAKTFKRCQESMACNLEMGDV